ncbi:MAG TPA: acyltransferase [Acidimicrobiia bacterium]|nr:acyltransferase [Acidimicrobiia bacterium]
MITQPVTPEETERPRAVATIGVRVLNYLTNHVVNRVPSYSLRHAWYRRVLGLSMGRGSGVHLGCYVWFYGPGQLRRSGFHIGANTRINRDCCLDARGPLHIGDNVSVSPEVAILTTQHSLDAGGFPLESRPVVIEDHVWIGMRAMILPGTTVGRGAVIAAGAVARGVIPPMTVVAGVPARPIGTRPAEGIGYELDAPFPLFE